MRQLEPGFITNLKSGILFPILERVWQDHTLMLAIRDNIVNIYYRGGSILKLTPLGYSYNTFFDENYNINGLRIPVRPLIIQNIGDALTWVDAFSYLKQVMDFFFAQESHLEREFQQLVVRENNFSNISNDTEYFITDIELADSELNARFDMLAVSWPARCRLSSSRCRPVIIEMKYGDDSLDQNAGLLAHLRDMEAYIKKNKHELFRMVTTQFQQLCQLALIKCKCPETAAARLELNLEHKPEVIFLLANHNPRSEKLSRILNNSELDRYASSMLFDLRFFVSSFAGYGLHADCMLTLSQIRQLILSNK